MPSSGSRFHRAIPSRLWGRIRRAVIARDGGICQLCGLPALFPEVDHITPLEEGGAPLDMANLRTTCRTCHVERHRRPVPDTVRRWWALVDEL